MGVSQTVRKHFLPQNRKNRMKRRNRGEERRNTEEQEG